MLGFILVGKAQFGCFERVRLYLQFMLSFLGELLPVGIWGLIIGLLKKVSSFLKLTGNDLLTVFLSGVMEFDLDFELFWSYWTIWLYLINGFLVKFFFYSLLLWSDLPLELFFFYSSLFALSLLKNSSSNLFLGLTKVLIFEDSLESISWASFFFKYMASFFG